MKGAARFLYSHSGERVPAHETLLVAALLAFVGGFLDAYTYVFRGGIFANAQTGNIVLLAIVAANGEFLRTVDYIVPIVTYFIGVMLAEIMRQKTQKSSFSVYAYVVTALEFAFILAMGFMPASVSNLLIVSCVSFVCAMQTSCFKRIGRLPYASTMCTGNLRSAAEQIAGAAVNRDKKSLAGAGRYLFVILCFIVGAVAGAFLTEDFGAQAVWACNVVLLIVAAVMFGFYLLGKKIGPDADTGADSEALPENKAADINEPTP